jgi:nitroreductase
MHSFTDIKKILKIKMDIIEKLKWRYATKLFDSNKKISQKQIDTIKEAVNLTATSYGMQPFKMIIVSNQEIKEKLTEAAFGQINVSTASHVLIFAAKTNIDNDYIDSHVENLAQIRNVELNSLVSYKANIQNFIKKKSLEQLLKWASDQCYIALGNLLTVCAIEKIDACPMGGFDAEKFDEILYLKEKNLHSVVFANLGYRSEDDKYAKLNKVRRPLNEMFIEL